MVAAVAEEVASAARPLGDVLLLRRQDLRERKLVGELETEQASIEAIRLINTVTVHSEVAETTDPKRSIQEDTPNVILHLTHPFHRRIASARSFSSPHAGSTRREGH